MGLCYLVACLTFDSEIHRYCERTGFVLRSSRSRKFYLFFFVLFLMVFLIVVYYCLAAVWHMPQDWIVNAVRDESTCKKQFSEHANNTLGMQWTFEKSFVLFVVIGAIFGQPFTLLYLSPMRWVHTTLWKRLVRMVIGIAISASFWTFMHYITRNTNDMVAHYFFGEALPSFICSFFIFGLFPVICQCIGLVQSEKEFMNMFPEIAGNIKKSQSKLMGLNASKNSFLMSPQSSMVRDSNRPPTPTYGDS